MVDQVKLAATAKRLIAKDGRSISLIKKTTVDSNPAKPWEGKTGDDVPLVITAVSVPPNTVRQFGITALGHGSEFEEMTRRSEKIYIIAPDGNDLNQYESVDDRGVSYSILATQILEPGEIEMLAFIAVRR